MEIDRKVETGIKEVFECWLANYLRSVLLLAVYYHEKGLKNIPPKIVE